jgi:hypothetical protein
LLPGPLRTTLSSAPLGALSPTEARAILREIRRAVNEFRDDRWSGLVRARNRLLAAVIFTGLTAYLLLALAVAMDARREVIAGMGAFYLVGAVVGLFNRMHADAGTEAAVAAVEDYGFSWAQLMHTPLFSGLAALGGVALLALLPAVAPVPGPLVGSPTPAATGTPVAPPAPVMRQVPATPPLGDIFDLTRNPVGLLVAAVFGLTSSLLTDRLRQQAENYKADLRSTQASNRQPVLGRT